jgi:hypothetical protein
MSAHTWGRFLVAAVCGVTVAAGLFVHVNAQTKGTPEIRFNKEGVGQGKMSVYTKISLSKDKQTVELENFDIEPVRLTEVRIEK